MELIDRNELITALKKAYVDTDGGRDIKAVKINVGITKALHIVQDAPVVQATLAETIAYERGQG